jgi:cation diffusion facilitator CzcD-associated flavoprotein CzcO
MSSILPVAIVGAGPYGLSLAAHLDAHGVPFRIFGRPMDTWASHMPRGMFLKSEGMASDLWDPDRRYTLRRWCEQSNLAYGDYGHPIPLDDLVGYGLWFQQELVPKVEEELVEEVESRPGELSLRLGGGEVVRARTVVMAIGCGAFAHVPASLRSLPAELVTHTWDLPDLATFTGTRVLVVGGGQSALESAALLAEEGATVHVLVRKPQLAWNPFPSDEQPTRWSRVRHPVSGLGSGWKLWLCANRPTAFTALPERTRLQAVRTILGPAGGWWLRNRVEGRLQVTLGHHIRSARATGDGVVVEAADGSGSEVQLEADHVVAATGYRVSVHDAGLWGPRLQQSLVAARGYPELSRTFGSSVPGLYFVGLAAALRFGPVMRFLYGAGFTADHLARHLASAVTGRERS